MGMIRIQVLGSFNPNTEKKFSAMSKGHAQAVADAIKYLSEEVLPNAISNDHECHRDGEFPTDGFGNRGIKK